MVCPGDPAVLTATGGSAYYWNTSQTTASITEYPTAQTTYSVTVTSNGCTAGAMHTVDVYTLIPVNAGPDTIMKPGDNYNIHATGGTSWSWSPSGGLSCTNCQNPLASPQETTTYTVVATDSNNCHSVDYVTVSIEVQCGSVYVPDAFSPNGDNINDTLFVHGNCIAIMEFIIYERWGEKVFSSTDTSKGWDGTYHDKPLVSGVFFYTLKATLSNGNIVNKSGNISLVR